ncbi:MAG: Gx transporter family protein [Roseburia sp.]|nr:Gx transporter family protein [Ruminococcus sp.]MCM1154597.1 Gx transporter family protein [Roseburia sp.]MCM1241682.1 Gx transporter family protein [Roseburia sp.]
MRKKTVVLGFLLAVSMILSYIESLLPFGIGIPGVKLGLPNLAVVLVLYTYGGREALTVNGLRILLTGFLFGNLASILYAVSGALCSFGIMCLLRKTGRFSIAGVSIGGGIFHNIGQSVVAMLVVETFAPAFYLPFLLIAGLVTGFVIGIVSARILPYVERLRAHMS